MIRTLFQMGFPVDIGSFHFLNTSQGMQGAVQTGTEVFPIFLVEDIDVTCRHENMAFKSRQEEALEIPEVTRRIPNIPQ